MDINTTGFKPGQADGVCEMALRALGHLYVLAPDAGFNPVRDHP